MVLKYRLQCLSPEGEINFKNCPGRSIMGIYQRNCAASRGISIKFKIVGEPRSNSSELLWGGWMAVTNDTQRFSSAANKKVEEEILWELFTIVLFRAML